jgi:rare lipoprotein A (peptidoglycan hydrolase)
MGFGMLIWSWLAFSLPVQQQNLQLAVQKTEMAKMQMTGIASFYHPRFVGRPTATGDIFSNDKFTAASNHFKLGTYVKVTNRENGKYIYVLINDRMGQPHRIIDLTKRAAKALSFVQQGLTKVTIEPVPSRLGKMRILAQIAPAEEQNATRWRPSAESLPDNIL